MEGDGLGLDLSLLHIDLVTAENDGDVLADADEIAYHEVVSETVGDEMGRIDLRCQLGTFL